MIRVENFEKLKISNSRNFNSWKIEKKLTFRNFSNFREGN